jgi:hypothetical protein
MPELVLSKVLYPSSNICHFDFYVSLLMFKLHEQENYMATLAITSVCLKVRKMQRSATKICIDFSLDWDVIPS